MKRPETAAVSGGLFSVCLLDFLPWLGTAHPFAQSLLFFAVVIFGSFATSTPLWAAVLPLGRLRLGALGQLHIAGILVAGQNAPATSPRLGALCFNAKQLIVGDLEKGHKKWPDVFALQTLLLVIITRVVS